MKLQFDTTEKIIKIEETVNLGELIDKLEMLLPSNQWREFKLVVSVISNWSDPIIITRPLPIVYPYRPFWEQPIITCLATTNLYNVQC